MQRAKLILQAIVVGLTLTVVISQVSEQETTPSEERTATTAYHTV